ncbi:MAG: hypothetical protein AAB299_08865, partial [Thermodesulfobacteriota bacterium]
MEMLRYGRPDSDDRYQIGGAQFRKEQGVTDTGVKGVGQNLVVRSFLTARQGRKRNCFGIDHQRSDEPFHFREDCLRCDQGVRYRVGSMKSFPCLIILCHQKALKPGDGGDFQKGIFFFMVRPVMEKLFELCLAIIDYSDIARLHI